MYITFSELRSIKHNLPEGSIRRMSEELNIPEQTIRNYFGANKYDNASTIDKHLQPGPNGGIIEIEDTTILDLARRIIDENSTVVQQ